MSLRFAAHCGLRVAAIATLLVSAITTQPAQAQAWPAKPIRLIVPAPAGSPPDHGARWLAERLSPALGQPVVIENRPGAAGIIGAALAAKATPDGYTIISVHQGTLAFNPLLYSKPGYDPIRDFAPIVRTQGGSMVLAVNADTAAKSLTELIALAKAQPGKLSNGTAGIGTPPYMAAELFRRTAGLDVTLVPFQAGNFAIADLVAGRVTYTIDGIGITLPHVKAGRLRMLAVTGSKRMPQIPDVPTFAEAGLGNYSYETWGGYAAPAGTPEPIVQRLAAEISNIIASSDGTKSMLDLGWMPITGDTPAAFAAHVKEEHARWGAFIRAAGLKVE